MANTLGVYDPIFYANEALIHLWKALGMATRVHLGYSEERKSFGKGQTISIRKPSTFSAVNAPDTTGQDLATETVNIVLDQWKEVKFKLTDQELAFTQERIIDDHIAPAAYALADNIDQALTDLYKDVAFFDDLNATPGSTVDDLLAPRKTLFDNNVPIQDSQFMHYMINGTLEQGFLGLQAFAQAQGAGLAGVDTQLRGTLGMRYGVEVFANQNVKTHTKGTIDDTALEVNGAQTQGSTTIDLNAVDAGVAGTLVAGDTFSIAGNTQRYAVTALNTAAANVFTNVDITPSLVQAYSDNDVVTVSADGHVANLMFHRNAFALVIAPLPEIGNELGARVATVSDPVTGLSLRSRIFYEANTSEVRVALDVLYGVKTLDPNLATRGRG